MTVVSNYSKIDQYKPIDKIGNNEYIIAFDKKDILSTKSKEVNGILIDTDEVIPTGDCTYKSFVIKSKLSANQIVNLIYNIIDEETKHSIINLFKWNGYSIYLSTENQMNYKNAFDVALATDGSNLPVTFKFNKSGKTNYYTFDSVEELKAFYLAVNKHITSCLKAGWNAKDRLDINDYK